MTLENIFVAAMHALAAERYIAESDLEDTPMEELECLRWAERIANEGLSLSLRKTPSGKYDLVLV